MTGGTPRYLRADPAWPGPSGQSIFAQVPSAIAPPKISAPYLAPRLKSRRLSRAVASR